MSRLVFEWVRFKNLLTFGNDYSFVDLNNNLLSAIMGEDLDTGGNHSRNGVGKSAIIDAICYALFGKVLRGVSNPKLRNKLARKGQSMVVELCFQFDKYQYKIERSEAPSKLMLYKRPIGDTRDWKDTEVKDGVKAPLFAIQKDKTELNADIVELLGFDITLFEYVCVNSSESTPFLKLPEDKKRDVIEKLLGFGILSKRAKKLKEIRKDVNKSFVEASATLEATKKANDRVQEQIDDLNERSQAWERKHRRTVSELEDTIKELMSADAEEEIEILKLIDELGAKVAEYRSTIREHNSDKREIAGSLKNANRDVLRIETRLAEIKDEESKLDEGTCPTCGQAWEPDPAYRGKIATERDRLEAEFEDNGRIITECEALLKPLEVELARLDEEVKQVEADLDELNEVELFFSDIEDASNAKANLATAKQRLDDVKADSNPHTDSIKGLREKALADIDTSVVDELKKRVEHYTYLISLMTDSDSYVRRHIIQRWLPRLNGKIAKYLDQLQLEYEVRFHNDLTVTIRKYHDEYEWGNLSRGQRQRLTVALQLAFQDIFRFLNYDINLLMVDELLDNGICNKGAENAVELLRDLANKHDHTIYLITHREDIADRIDNILMVVKEDDISRIEELE